MKARQVIVIGVAIAAVALIAIWRSGEKDGSDGGGGVPENAVRVTFVYSPEKEKLLKPLVERFNEQDEEVDGRPVLVEGRTVSSGEAQAEIAAKQLKPTAWSPASSLWGRLLNFEADAAWAPDENPSIVRTPLVIAMWEPLARALGWPRKPVGFKQLLELATSTRGWAAYGKPEFGRFKLGHTNPDFSTSGLSAVAAQYYAASGKREGLTVEDVERPAVRRTIRAIERSIVHYGDTTLFFAEQLRQHGPAFASAVAMEEVTLVDFNRGRQGTKLVGIYPAEGTFFSDNPFIVLDAPWVTSEQRGAARLLQRFLAREVTAGVAARYGFRPGDPRARVGEPISAANGADPAQPRRVLSLPEPRVLDRIRTAWREDRKPANVMLVLDTSGSMSEEGKLDQAKEGLKVFFREPSPRDRVGLMTFNERVSRPVPLRPFAENGQALRSTVQALIPDGGTAVYDAVDEGFDAIRALNDEDGINAVVALTDGEDTDSALRPEALVAKLRQSARPEQLTVRVFTIAYGSDANRDILRRIASASGGEAFDGDPSNIESVYKSISSFF